MKSHTIMSQYNSSVFVSQSRDQMPCLSLYMVYSVPKAKAWDGDMVPLRIWPLPSMSFTHHL